MVNTNGIANLFETFNEGSPFDLSNDESLEEDIMANEGTESAISDDDSEGDHCKQDKVEFVDGKTVEYSTVNSHRKKDLGKV